LLGKDDLELEFAKALNKSAHGSHLGNYIDKKEVAKKLKQMLQEKKAVVGLGGYLDRASVGRITRGPKLMWGRNSKQDFDGSLTDWNEWRQEAEFEKQCVANGGVTRHGAIECAMMLRMSWTSMTRQVRIRLIFVPWNEDFN
jgi:hypothetical protein